MKKLAITLLGATCLLSQAAYAQQLSVQLTSMKQDLSYCRTYWAVQNTTGLNITSLIFPISYKEADGSMLDKKEITTDRIKNGGSVDAGSLLQESCSKIKTIKVGGIMILFVDGESRRDLYGKVADVMVTSSKVAGVSVVK